MDDQTKKEGEYIGKYKVLEKIGEGAFGEVFKVKPPNLETQRAIKIPFINNSRVGQELKEANNQVKLTHPAVIQVQDIEEIGNERWGIVMEYAPGGNLRDKLSKEGAFPVDESIRYIEALADAISEAHKEDLLHYDIKPENILFDAHGKVKLADFGLARRMEQMGAQMSKVIGTIEYMGPEQLDGIEDPRSEIWSLGAVFYEMLTGKICFEGDNDSHVLNKIDIGLYKPVGKLNSNIPKALVKIVHKMLQRDPKRRYQSMHAVVQDLKDFRKEKPAASKTFLIASILLFIFGSLLSFSGGMFYADKADILNLPFLQRFGKIRPVLLPETIHELDFEDQFEQGMVAIQKGSYQLAYQVFKNIDKNVKDIELKEKAAFYKASIALHYMKDIDLAAAEFKAFLKNYPQSRSAFAGHAHFFLGQIYFKNEKDYYKAIKHLTTVVERYPANSKIEIAKMLIQGAARQIAKEPPSLLPKAKSLAGVFLPNNWISLLVSLLGLISAISMPLAWIMSQYHQPEIAHINSVRSGFRSMLKHKAIKKLILIVILSQLLSFALTQYQSHLDYRSSAGALNKVGVNVNIE